MSCAPASKLVSRWRSSRSMSRCCAHGSTAPISPPRLPDTAREGTRRNMLGEAAARCRAQPADRVAGRAAGVCGGAGAAQWRRGRRRSGWRNAGAGARADHGARAAAHHQRARCAISSPPVRSSQTGEAVLRQSELGLTPFQAPCWVHCRCRTRCASGSASRARAAAPVSS